MSVTQDRAALLGHALAEIRDLKSRLALASRAVSEPIAIVGIGCRFPGGGDDPDGFWRMLEAGVEAVDEVPRERLDLDRFFDPDPGAPGKVYSRRAALLRSIDQFDPRAFGIAPREAEGMDPQHRLLLEVTWEALERAGQPLDQLRLSSTGVFVGMSSDDYLQLGVNPNTIEAIDPHLSLGTSRAVAVGRIAYLLGLQGPAVQLDTACSSSLVAVHLACQSLRLRECDLALAGGVHLILDPLGMIMRSRLQALSPDGRCRAFDAGANGYVQGEGCGIVVLRRLSDALDRGDHISAVILGSAINHDGPSNGLTAPNELAQEKVIRQALRAAGVSPDEVMYVEAHGTGTPLGDPIELGALRTALGDARGPDRPLLVGSVKTNLGHLEAAAGIVALIKTAIAVERRTIPPHLHFERPNPLIDFPGLVVPTRPMPWPEGRRVAGVSSFGISGTNVHMVLAESPAHAASAAAPGAPDALADAMPARPVHVISLSTRDDDSLVALAGSVAERLRAGEDAAAVAFTSNLWRTHHPVRMAVAARDAADAAALLDGFAAGQPSPRCRREPVRRDARRRLVFLFSGQSSQYPRMGAELYRGEPAFRRAFDACEEALAPHVGASVRQALYDNPRDEFGEDDMLLAQPILFAFQVGLTGMWHGWGIEPDAILGHSGGEYAAAVAAGVLSLQDGARLLASRNALMNTLPRNGAMLALLADEAIAVRAIEPYADRVAISAVNAPGNIVLSGERGAIDELERAFARDGVRAQRLAVSHGGHSPLMDPILPAFERVAREVALTRPQVALYSSVTGGGPVDEEVARAGYWVRQLRGPVRFADGVAAVLAAGYDAFLELGPKSTLVNLTRAAASPAAGETNLWLTSLRDGAGWENALTSLAALYAAGFPVDWRRFHEGRGDRRIFLPTYPFQRRRYWSHAVEVAMSTHAHRNGSNGKPHATSAASGGAAARPDIVVDTVREIVAEVLRLPLSDIAADTPLLELGVDSFTLVSVIHALALRYGVRLSVRQLFEELTTVEAIAARIRRDATPVTRDGADAAPAADKAAPSPAPAAPPARARSEELAESVRGLVAQALRLGAGELPRNVPLLELGADSFSLVSVIHALAERYGVRFTVRQLFEELPTVDAIAERIQTSADPSRLRLDGTASAPAASAPPAAAPAPAAPSVAPSSAQPHPAPHFPAPPFGTPYDASPYGAPPSGTSYAASPFGAPYGAPPYGAPYAAPQIGVPYAAPPYGALPYAPPGYGLQPYAAHLLGMPGYGMPPHAVQPGMPAPGVHAFAPLPYPYGPLVPPQAPSTGEPIAALTRQVESLARELTALRSAHPAPAPASAPQPGPTAPQPGLAAARPAPTPPASERVEPPATKELTPTQRRYLDGFIARYTARTARCRQQRAGGHTLCRRSPEFGFRFETKELFYPIIGHRAQGGRMWDLDSNEYVDLTMGFGTLLFGHSPAFLTETLTRQVQSGMLIGPEAEHAIEVSRLVCQTTGHERVQFTVSGTEAVMTAMRLARAATGRRKIALFRNSYHGHFDGTLVASSSEDGAPAPLVIGTPPAMVEDLLVLPFDDPRAIELITRYQDELAAVLVEPVQSRRPDVQARGFLHKLRALTARAGIVLIFDEIFHGYRVHPAGLQGYFGVKADLATYGKSVANGMPIGLVAGRSWILDHVDGGAWQYGDDSYPRTRKTFVAGTFAKHPMVMAAARACLEQIIARSPGLQERLNQRTAALASALNAYFAAEELPLRIVHFGSNFRFAVNGNLTFIHQFQPLELDIFFYHLIHAGLYVWEGRTCFLSDAHTDEDLDRVTSGVKQAVSAMREGGFWLPATGAARGDRTAPPVTWPAPAPAAPAPAPAASASAPTAPIPYLARSSAPIVQPERERAAVTAAHQVLAAGPARSPLPGTELPTTHDQRLFWLLAQMSEDGSICYNQATTLELRGDLDIAALRRAIQQTVDRHAALRTTLAADGHSQRVHPRVEVDVPVLDLAALEPAERDRRVATFYEAECRRAFDLGGFLFRFHFIRLEPRRHLLSSAVHFLVCDGVSLGIIFQDIQACYSALVRGVPLALPPPMQFGEAIRLRDQLAGTPELAAQEAYWLGEIERPLPVLDLPTDRPRPPVKTFAGRRHTIRIDANTYALLRRFSQERRCTYFMTLMGCFATLLHRLSGQAEVVIGAAFSGRNLLPGSESMVGFISNLLPIRCRVEEGMTFDAYLASLRSVLLRAYENQDYPLPSLIEKSRHPRDPSRSPLFSVVFNWDRYTIPDMHELDVRFFPQPIATAPRDIMPTVFEINGELLVNWDYNADLFDAETIARTADQFAHILDAVLERGDIEVARLPLLSDGERRRLVVEFNQTAAPVPEVLPLGELFARQAARTPDRVAVRGPGAQLTFRQLDARANQVAHWLRAHGVGPGAPVLLGLDRSPDAIAALLGVLKAGGAYVPVPLDAPPARWAAILREVGAPAAITASCEPLELPAGVVQVLHIDAADALTGLPTTPAGVAIDPAGLAYIIYTSGSTGQPKGARITHASVANLLAGLERLIYADTPPELRVAMNGALSFDTSVKQWIQLLRGRTLVVVPAELRTDPAAMLRFLADEWIDVLDQTPSQLRLLVDAGLLDTPAPHPGTVLVGGEAIDPALWDRLAGSSRRFFNLYGPTECTVDAVACRVERRAQPVLGWPLANVQAHVVDAALEPVAIGAVGELVIGGAGVGLGYVGAPDADSARFLPDSLGTAPDARLYRTGDLVRRRVDGALEYIGRADQQIKLRGHRIELAEIEAAVRSHAAVREAVVVLGQLSGAPALVAYVVPASGQRTSPRALQDHAITRLPAYMVPAAFVVLEALPLTANGKLDRAALPAPSPADQLVESYTPPDNPVEVRLAQAFAEVLQVERVGLRDDFFMMGGNSLMLPRLAARIHALVQVKLPLRLLFRHSTVQALAAHIATLNTPAREAGMP